MRSTLPLILGLLVSLSSALAGKSVSLGDWGEAEVPESFQTGVAFPVTVTVKKVDGPTRLLMNANWLKESGQFGGFLQLMGVDKEISGPGTHTFTVTIKKTKPDMKSAVLAIFLSPDGEWKNKTASGTVDLPLAAGGGGHETFEYEKLTAKAEPFFMATAPQVATLREGGFASEPAFVDDFDPGWPKKDLWRIARWKQNGTMMDPERARVDGEGNLVQTVKAGGPPYLGGSVETKSEFGYGRWVARVKPTSVPGALNSIFTKDWDDRTTDEPTNDGTGAEVDIEFLSYTFGDDSGKVHLAIHLPGRQNYLSLNPPLDFNPSDDYHEWGFDILPDRVVWHIDGKFLHEWKYTENAFINEDYEFYFNSWTMERWIHGPTKEDAHYHIDWVKFYPHEG